MSWGERARIKELEAVLNQFEAAAQKFIHKVESGKARSRETYTDMRAACEALDKLRKA